MTHRLLDSRFLGYLLSICIAVCGLVGWMAWEGRVTALQHATATADNLADALNQHTKRAVETVDLALEFIKGQLPQDTPSPRQGLRVHQMLRERLAAIPLIRELVVLDPEGRILFESGRHPARAAAIDFKNSVAGQQAGREPLEIGVSDTENGTPSAISFSRRLLHPDGTVGGRIVAFVEGGYFKRFYQRLDLGPNDEISIFGLDGTLLLRKPSKGIVATNAGLAVAERVMESSGGSFESYSPSSGSTWLNSFRRVEGLPLVVMISIEERHALAAWRRDATRHAILGFLLVGAVLSFGVFLWQQVGRRESAEGREKATRGDLEHKHAVIETILRTLPDGVCLFDRDLNIAACNDQLFRILGLDRSEILALPNSGRAFREALAERSGSGFGRLQSVQEVEEMTRSGGQYHGQLADGRWIECRHTPVGEQGFLSVYRDMTEQTHRETELREAYARAEQQTQRLAAAAEELGRARASAEQANLTKSRFLANMSHELRTPLNAINGFSEVIAGLYLGRDAIDRYQDYARDIHASGQHLLELINEVLDLSKVEAGRMELREDIVDLGDTVYAALKMVEAPAEAKHLALNLQTPSSPIQLQADGQKLLQCFLNVLSNAVKFTPEGGRVSVAVSSTLLGPIVTIKDTGIGIAPMDMAKVFEPFGQVDSDLTRDTPGTGLGIPLTRSLIELHGGSIGIESVENVGTTITLRLPRHRLLSFQRLAKAS